MSITSKSNRVAELRRQLADAERDLARAKRVREEEPPLGSKILIRATFPSDPHKTYEYMAMRVSSRAGQNTWYVTGMQGRVSWDQIIARVERADYEIFELNFVRL